MIGGVLLNPQNRLSENRLDIQDHLEPEHPIYWIEWYHKTGQSGTKTSWIHELLQSPISLTTNEWLH